MKRPQSAVATISFLIAVSTSVATGQVIYLQAGFDDKEIGAPIGTGGAEVGEPISVGSQITAIVRAEPMPTPALEIHDNSTTSAGSARFEFLGQQEVDTGRLVLFANLWFAAPEDFFIYVREQGGAAQSFTNIRFSSAGDVICSDANGNVGTIGAYVAGRHFPVMLDFNMNTDVYDVWLDGTRVLAGEGHGIVGRGIGAVLFGCTNDADLSGTAFVDDIMAANFVPPKIFLRANFNNKTIDMPIGEGGAEVGEPELVTPGWAIVRDIPTPTPSLEVSDNDDYSAGGTIFGFLREAEVTSGRVVIAAHLWFDILDGYYFRVCEQGSAAQQFLSIDFTDSGNISVRDAGGWVGNYGPYDTGRFIEILADFDMDLDRYDLYWDGVRIVNDEPHNVVGWGVGSVLYGVLNDANYRGWIYADNIWAGQGMPPQRAACCRGTICTLLNPGDCKFVDGEHHPEWGSCQPNPCLPSEVAEGIPGAVPSIVLAPNPFRGSVRIDLAASVAGGSRIAVYDAGGKMVRELLSLEMIEARSILWDGCDNAMRKAPAGVYFVRIETADSKEARTLVRVE